MKDIKSLFEAAKNTQSQTNITAYKEAVNELLESKPSDFLSNLKYIITSDIGFPSLSSFVEKYGISIAAYEPIMESLNYCIEQCDKKGVDSTPYKDFMEKMELTRSKYQHCYDMYEYYKDDDMSSYLEAYYSKHKSGIQNNMCINVMIDNFNECAIADAMITGDHIDGKAVCQVLEYVLTKSPDKVLSQWVCECTKDVHMNYNNEDGSFNNRSSSELQNIFESASLSAYVSSMEEAHNNYMRESLILGESESEEVEYTENDISAIRDLISFKEYQITCMESSEDAIKLQNEVYELYESYGGILEDTADEILPMLPQQKSITEDLSWRNTRNKKTGNAPSYLSTNHNLGYGEEDDPDDINSYKRKSVTQTDDEDDDTTGINTSDDNFDDDEEVGVKPTTPEERKAVNNYYYYTYNNSLNKHTDNSVNNSRRTDDHSTGKTTGSYNKDDHSHHNGNDRDKNIPHTESDDNFDDGDGDTSDVSKLITEFKDPTELDIFGGSESSSFFIEGLYNNEFEVYEDCCEAIGNILNSTFMESGDNQRFKFAYKAAYDFNTGHAIKITYSLNPITITNVGVAKPVRDEILSIVNKTAEVANEKNLFKAILTALNGIIKSKHNIEMRKTVLTEILNDYIDKVGYVDFQAKDCKIVSITDRVTKGKLKGPIDIVGVYAAADLNENRSLALSPYTLKRMQDRVRRRGSNFKISTISVGDIQTVPTFMSTYWDRNCDKGLVNQNGDLIIDDDMDRDNLSQIISSREIQGFDIDTKKSRFTDALGDFVDPIRNIGDSRKNKLFKKLAREDSNKSIYKALKILTNASNLKKNLKKAEGVSEDDISVIDEFIDSLNTKYIKANELLKSDDHEGVFNTLNMPETLDQEQERLDNLCTQLQNKYEINVKFESVGDADDNKPESDHPVRDILMDIDREKVKSQQKLKKTVQNVQNVARAAVKPAQRTKQWLTNMVNDWKDKDENAIKEKMADPNARRNIFSAVSFAIKTGSLFKAGLLLNPVFLFLSITKKISNNKNQQRIRNEMIGELKTELEVIDAKIEDAKYNNDNKAKYQLMRLRNEINKKLLRVSGSESNKKWTKKGELL